MTTTPFAAILLAVRCSFSLPLALTLACTPGDDSHEAGDEIGTSDGETGQTGETEDGSSEGEGESSESGSDDESTTDSGTDDETSTSTGESSESDSGGAPVCVVFGDAAEACGYGTVPYEDCLIGMQNAENAGGDCPAAAEAWFLCLSALSCEDLPAGVGCEDEGEALVRCM